MDDIDRKQRTMEAKLEEVFQIFDQNCQRNNVRIDIVKHICDILCSSKIFGYPDYYAKLARKISELVSPHNNQ